MQKNLSIVNFTGEDADTYSIRYARIDNVDTPVYTSAGISTAAQFPVSISNVENGQYRVGVTPVYADGRACSETPKDTSPCQGIIAFNGQQDDSGNIQFTYTAPGDVPQVLLTVNYPNGGSYQQAYTNGSNGGVILVPIPTGLNGTYTAYMQSICDPDTGFYSTPTPPVSISIGTVNMSVSSSIGGVVITEVNGVLGYSLSAPVGSGGSDTGFHETFTGVITIVFTGYTYSGDYAAILTVNSIRTDCKVIPNTNGGVIQFDSGTYYTTDYIVIVFAPGTC